MSIRTKVLAFVAASVCALTAAAEDATTSAPAPAITPHASELLPRAAQSLTLGITAAGDQLIAVGERGHILRSHDGKDWQQVQTPVRATLTAVGFADAQNGWAVGHDAVILHTQDAGATWTLQNFQPELEEPLLDVLALDAQHAFVSGAFGLFRETEDGGAHWHDVEAPDVLEGGLHLYRLRRLADGTLFVAGEQGRLGVSHDGGKTWARLESPYEGTFFGATAVGEHGVVVCGLRGNAFYAADINAPSWQKIDTGNPESLFGAATLPDGRVVLVGLNGRVLVFDPVNTLMSRLPSPVDTVLSGVEPWQDGLVTVGESGPRWQTQKPQQEGQTP